MILQEPGQDAPQAAPVLPPDALQDMLRDLRAQLTDGTDPDVALTALLGGLADVSAHSPDDAPDPVADWALGLLIPVQRALDRADRQRRAGLAALVGGVAGPCIALSVAGLPLARNAQALAHPGLQGAIVGTLCSAVDFAAFVARCRTGTARAALLVPVAGDTVLVGGWSQAHQVVILTLPCWDWPPGLAAEVQTAFHLTPREVEIVGALMQGLGPEAIAARDGRSVGTLRQQLKAIYGKLGVAGQTQVVALIAGVGSAWQRLAPLVGPGDATALRSDVIQRGARRIGLRRYGVPGGRPLVMIHGALFGAGDVAAERDAAARAGWDVLAVERPGYGRTTDSGGRDDRDVAVADLLAAMDHAGFARCPVLAHDVGTATACLAARLAPNRIAGIVAAPATPPMVRWDQTAVMPRAHRVHAWVVQRAPRLLDLVISLGLSHVRAKGAAILPDLFFPGCEHDRAVLAQPEMNAGLTAALHLIAAQDARGFRRDMLVTNLDWRADAADLSCPVLLLHGARSRTVDGAAVAHFAASLAQGRVHVVADAGHTLPLSHPDLVLRLLADLAT